jgi:transketolase
MAARGGCFLGAALSCADVLAYLYGRFLRVGVDSFGTPDRDYFLLSKGHAVPALYGALVERGFLAEARIENHLDVTDSVYWHPNCEIPGVDFHTGSLGHALAVGTGIALDVKLRGRSDRVVVMLGDGELDEGSIWEALLFASSARLDNLVLVVDRNGLQANVETEALVPLEPLGDKLRAFGCRVTSCDGHSFAELRNAFSFAAEARGAPSAVVARTIRGKGLPTIEGRVDGWFVKLDGEGREARLSELAQGADPRIFRAPEGGGPLP